MLPSSIALANFVRFRMPAPAPDLERRAPSPVLAQPSVDWEARGEVRRELVRSVQALDELERILGTGRRGAVEPARAQSQLDIGLDPSPATAATLGSLTEVNAIPHSFSSYAPPWSGSSSAALVLDGDYNGDNGTTTLTFESKRNGTHGSKDLRIDVLDPGGNRIDRIDIKKSDPLDKVYSLSNGMTFTLGAGSLVKKDTLTVDVSATTGTAVDPDKPLDGVGDDDARLESALVVGPGNFTINGSTIDVFSGDSLNDVLGRINASGAGVTASFDAPSERVVLTQSTTGSAPSIVLGVDSSGFLAATKLDGAAVIPGTDYEPDVALSSLSQFSAVSSGTVSVNGVDVAIDVNADSLLDVLSRINTSGAGVLATLSPSAQRVTIESTDRDRSLTLEQNTTGFFTALKMDEGTYQAPFTDRRFSKPQSYRAADALEAVNTALEHLMRTSLLEREPALAALQPAVQGVLSATVLSEGERPLSKLGVNIHEHTGGTLRLDVDRASRKRFTHQLQRDVRPIHELMLGGSDSATGGLLDKLRSVLQSSAAGLRSGDPLGNFINLSA